MPANIPGAVVTGGGQRQGLPEQLLLTLASAAPGILMQYLGMRQQSADAEAQGQAATGVLADLVRTGKLSPELFQSVGGQYTPAVAGMEGKTVQGTMAPSGLQTPTLSMAARPAQAAVVNTAGINQRVAPQLLQQALATQESVARTDSANAQTELARAEEGRAAERHPLALQQLREGVKTEQFNRFAEQQRLGLQRRQTDAAISNDAARLTIDRENQAIARQNAVVNVAQYLSALHSDQMRNYTNLAQLLGDPTAASVLVFKSTSPVDAETFINANMKNVQQGLLTRDGDPGQIILSTVLGDRPDVEVAQRIGLEPANAARITKALEANKGNATTVYNDLRKQLRTNFPDSPEQVAEELAAAATFITVKTGAKFDVPAEDKKGIAVFLRRLLDNARADTDPATLLGLPMSGQARRLSKLNSRIQGAAPPAK